MGWTNYLKHQPLEAHSSFLPFFLFARAPYQFNLALYLRLSSLPPVCNKVLLLKKLVVSKPNVREVGQNLQSRKGHYATVLTGCVALLVTIELVD